MFNSPGMIRDTLIMIFLPFQSSPQCFLKSFDIWMFPNIGMGKPPKMDGEKSGKPYEQMDDLGVPLFLETPI